MKTVKVKNAYDDNRVLPVRHLSARVPWHDQKWNGKTCKNVVDNSFCRILTLVDLKKEPENEPCNVGVEAFQPPCVSEKGTFLSSLGFTRHLVHRYKEMNNRLFADFGPCQYDHKPFSINVIPFKWLMKSTGSPNLHFDHTDRPHRSEKGNAYEVGYDPSLEAEIDRKLGFEGNIWVQSSVNQKALLNTFFGCLQKESSLIFFYAKHTPFSEPNERVLVGVAKVAESPGPLLEYTYPRGYNGHRSYPWDRCLQHTLRLDGSGEGVLLPYHDILDFISENQNSERADQIDLRQFVACAPEAAQFSYAAELVEHDTAIDALLIISEALRSAAEFLGRSYDVELEWLDTEISRIWDMRGGFPGMGPVLSAIGIENGNSIAWEIERHILSKDGDLLKTDPWKVFEDSLEKPDRFLGPRGVKLFKKHIQAKWKSKSESKREFCRFVSRCQLTNEQAKHLYDKYELKPDRVTQNPYRLYEETRFDEHGLTFTAIDKALFPPAKILEAFPLPDTIGFEEDLDPRRVRAVCVLVLEEAASNNGHSLLPFDDLLHKVSEKRLETPLPIDRDVLDYFSKEESFEEEVGRLGSDEGGPRFFKLARLAEIKNEIAGKINYDDVKNGQLTIQHDWLGIVNTYFDEKFGPASDAEELEARYEKAEALRVLANSRVTILIGPAGAGKTELLNIFKTLPEIDSVLELAPTGKARVKLSPHAKTLAQFLLEYKRYDVSTGTYSLQPNLRRYSGSRNVVVDECSMLTEEQLAALLDTIGHAFDRLILVGDHRQLPPIGTGRPFFDLADRFVQENASGSPPMEGGSNFRPRTGSGYAELTKIRRQVVTTDPRLDLKLGRCFSDRFAKEDLEIFSKLSSGDVDTENLRTVKWYASDDFREIFTDVLEDELGLKTADPVRSFNLLLGATPHEKNLYFNIGAEKVVEEWQILSPETGYGFGTREINKTIQKTYRSKYVEFALSPNKRIPRPVGSDNVVYGDKVLNLRNSKWLEWQKIEESAEPHPRPLRYIANGEIGIITGEFLSKNASSSPNVEISFSTQPGCSYVFKQGDLTEGGRYGVELAYAITVHKAQGSGFEKTFLVLPSQSAVLSRELIYTALTRQKKKVIIFHQGEFRDFIRFASTEASATARRFTDLFFLPEVQQIEKKWYDRKYVNVSERGEPMISKNEVIIANLLNKFQPTIDYVYEDKLKFEETGRMIRPDFTITNTETGRRFYWEHLGMMTLRNYRERWTEKLISFKRDGFVLHNEANSDSAKVLIVTEENPNGGIDSQHIDDLIKKVILNV